MTEYERFYVQSDDDESYRAICLGDVDDCDWVSLPSLTEEDAVAQAERHLESEHQADSDNEPKDWAKTELDKGLSGIDDTNAQGNPSHERMAEIQQHAQLHLLASIATSLYDIRTAGLRALETLAMPKVMVQSPQEMEADHRRALGMTQKSLDQRIKESIARGLADVAEGRIRPRDEVTSEWESTCDQCSHPVSWHNEFGGCVAVTTQGPTHRCGCPGPPEPEAVADDAFREMLIREANKHWAELRKRHIQRHKDTEEGRILANQRDDLIAQGVDPQELEVPLAPSAETLHEGDLTCPHCLHAVKIHDEEFGCNAMQSNMEMCSRLAPGFDNTPPGRMHGWAEDALELKRQERVRISYCPHCKHLYSFHDAEDGEGCTMTDENGERCGCIRLDAEYPA